MAEKKKGFVLADALAGVPKVGTDAQGREQIEYIDIDLIDPDPKNRPNLSGITELAENIEHIGIQQPIRLRIHPDDPARYMLISGHRRTAAMRLLVEEGNEKYRLAPCIVDRDKKSDARRRLELLQNNLQIQALTPAQLADYAQEVETCLYEMKEDGEDFPGRMRNHVAKACKVSKSKLSRLKVIRENLGGEMKEQWEAGELNESEAYELAKLPPEHRALVWARKGTCSWNRAGGTAVETYGKRLKAIDASPVPKDCPAGGVCENRAGRREKSFSDSIYLNSRCEECCHGCPYIAACKHACHLLGEEIADAKAKVAASKAADKAQSEARSAERRAQREESLRFAAKGWRRLGAALEKSGKSALWLAEVLEWDQDEEEMSEWTPLLEGKKVADDSYWAADHPFQDMDIKDMAQLADDLGVSLDYLLCRTDDPNPVPTSGTAPTWQTGTPPASGYYYVKFNCGGEPLCMVAYWDQVIETWTHRNMATSIDADALAWYPLPPTDEEAADGK